MLLRAYWKGLVESKCLNACIISLAQVVIDI